MAFTEKKISKYDNPCLITMKYVRGIQQTLNRGWFPCFRHFELLFSLISKPPPLRGKDNISENWGPGRLLPCSQDMWRSDEDTQILCFSIYQVWMEPRSPDPGPAESWKGQHSRPARPVRLVRLGWKYRQHSGDRRCPLGPLPGRSQKSVGGATHKGPKGFMAWNAPSVKSTSHECL